MIGEEGRRYERIEAPSRGPQFVIRPPFRSESKFPMPSRGRRGVVILLIIGALCVIPEIAVWRGFVAGSTATTGDSTRELATTQGTAEPRSSATSSVDAVRRDTAAAREQIRDPNNLQGEAVKN